MELDQCWVRVGDRDRVGVRVWAGMRLRAEVRGRFRGRGTLPTKKQRKMKSETTRSSTKPWRTCNRRWRWLQPYVKGPATLREGACNPM